jgi:hypothetical protein
MTDDRNVSHAACPEPDGASTSLPPADPFDPASLRINMAAVPSFGAKKLLTTIPVKKPNKQSFVRVHKSQEFRLLTAVIEIKEDNEVYLVVPALHSVLAGEIILVMLFTAIDRQGNVFLWYVKMPKEDGRANDWHASALVAAEEATKAWVRVQANMSLGAYDVFRAEAKLPDPEWPKDMNFGAMLKVAFRDRFIETMDHPVVAKLQGRE